MLCPIWLGLDSRGPSRLDTGDGQDWALSWTGMAGADTGLVMAHGRDRTAATATLSYHAARATARIRLRRDGSGGGVEGGGPLAALRVMPVYGYKAFDIIFCISSHMFICSVPPHTRLSCAVLF